MQTGSRELIRDINTALIIKQVISEGGLSRADLSKKLGLSKATVSAIVQILIDKKLLVETGPGESTAGRRPTQLSFNAECGYVISIDIEYSKIYCMLSDLNGNEHTSINIKNKYNEKTILKAIIDTVSQLKKEIPKCKYGLVGVSVAVHGIVHDNKVLFTPYYNFENADIADTLSAEFDVPVFVNNEANLSAIGEHTFCHPQKNLINISIHSGIGLGLILDGELFEGHGGSAGEFGHTIIVPKGKECPCGNRGCLEQYASERAILNDLADKLKLDDLDLDKFVEMVREGNKDALAELDEFETYIGIGLNNILKLYDPELIIINCDLLAALPDTLNQIISRLNTSRHTECKIQLSSIQDKGILLGGVVVVRNDFLQL